MLKNILFVLSVLAIARAQIPSLGWCPEYVPMVNFDMGRFLGLWYEAERYFPIFDPASRCVAANYTKGSDGKYRVSNEVTNRFTGIKRVLDGEIRTPATKAEEGKLHVKYTTIPLTPETQYAVLETDYKSYAVLWSCSGIGPFNAQNAWVMTRARRADGTVLQKAYGVLDKYKISRTYFVKTNQDDCGWFDETTPAPIPSASPPMVETPVMIEENAVVEEQEAKNMVNLRSAMVPEEEPSVDDKIVEALPSLSEQAEDKSQSVKTIELVAEKIEKELDHVGKTAELTEVPRPSSVPEIILEAADRAKDIAKKAIEDVKKFEPIETIKVTFENPGEKIQEAFERPIEQIKETFEKPIEQIKETFQKPLDKIKEVINIPASDGIDKSKENVAVPSEETIVHEKEETSEKNIKS